MAPQALVFSSNEGTARTLAQALTALEFDVELCPEIFSALEKLPAKKFDVIAVDWNEGAEARFLLQAVRESRTSQGAFIIAVSSAAKNAAVLHAGADLALIRPITSEQIKYDLLNCAPFLVRVKTWPSSELMTSTGNQEAPVEPQLHDNHGANPQIVSLADASAVGGNIPEDVPRFASLETGIFNRPPRQRKPTRQPRPAARQNSSIRNMALRITAMVLTFCALCGWLMFSQSVEAAAVANSVTNIYVRAVETTKTWLHSSKKKAAPAVSSEEDDFDAQFGNLPEPASPAPAPPTQNAPVQGQKIVLGTPPTNASLAPAETQPMTPADPGTGLRVPESIRAAYPMGSKSKKIDKIIPTTSLLGALEPVALPEDVSEKLIVERFSPIYPEQALRNGLQGPVVLQAWISKDGRVEDVKFVRGYLVLAQAAAQAVRLWRYKPYFRNGEATEAQTFITIDFKLPQEASTLPRP